MYSTLIYTLIVISFSIVILILSQPSKQQDALSLLSSDKSSPLFKTQKSSGLHYLFQYITAFLGISWLVLGIILVSFT